MADGSAFSREGMSAINLPCSFFPCFLGKGQEALKKKTRTFTPTEPLKSWGKEGKNAQLKNKEEFLEREKQKNKEIPPRKRRTRQIK